MSKLLYYLILVINLSHYNYHRSSNELTPLEIIDNFSNLYINNINDNLLNLFDMLNGLFAYQIFKNHDKCKYIQYQNNNVISLSQLNACFFLHISKQLKKNINIIDKNNYAVVPFNYLKQLTKDYPQRILEIQNNINNGLEIVYNSKDFDLYGYKILNNILIPLFNLLKQLYLDVIFLYLPLSGPISILKKYEPIYNLLNIKLTINDEFFQCNYIYNIEEIFDNLNIHRDNPLIKKHFIYMNIDKLYNNFQNFIKLYTGIFEIIVHSSRHILNNVIEIKDDIDMAMERLEVSIEQSTISQEDFNNFYQMINYMYDIIKNFFKIITIYEEIYYFFININENNKISDNNKINVNLSLYEQLISLSENNKITKYTKNLINIQKVLIIKMFNDYIEINNLLIHLIQRVFMNIKKYGNKEELQNFKNLILNIQDIDFIVIKELLKFFFYTTNNDNKKLLNINCFINSNNQQELFFNIYNIHDLLLKNIDNVWIKSSIHNIKLQEFILSLLNLKNLCQSIEIYTFN